MKSLTSIVLILVSIGIFFFFIDPQYKEIQDLQTEVEENEKTLELAKELRAKRESLRQKFAEISDDEKLSLEKLLPDTVDNVRLIIDINNIAEEYGIVIRNLQLSSEEDTTAETSVVQNEFQGVIEDSTLNYADRSKLGVIAFSFSVSAEYDVFIDFLKDLEEALRIVDVRSITITAASSEDQGLFYDYGIKLETYWLK